MAPTYSLNDFLLDCREVDDVPMLWQNALDFAHERGIKAISYHRDDAKGADPNLPSIVADGFPDYWVCEYLETELRLIDPIPHIASMTSRPFLWSDVPKLAKLSRDEVRYMDALAKSGIGDGLAVYVLGPKMRNACICMGFGEGALPPVAVEMFELRCAAQVAHIRYCELTENRRAPIDGLSPRELEILRWMARGKSNSVIAEILGISRHTVDTLSRRIYTKLGVNDRTTAAIRGLGAGLLRHRGGDVA